MISRLYTYAIWVDESSVTVKFTLVEISLVDHAIWEGELANAFLPVMRLGALVLTA